MTQELEKSWAGKILSSEELKEWADFQQSLNARYTETERETFKQKWVKLANQVEANLDQDPTSEFGISLGKKCMELVNSLYGKKYARLRTAIWEKGVSQFSLATFARRKK